MNKPKARGTAFESWIVRSLEEMGLRAQRIAEGGSQDRGDIELVDAKGVDWVLEAKSRERLNVTRELAKARLKGGKHTALVWKRLVKTGKQRRQPDGEPVVVVMAYDTFVDLMRRR